MISDADILTWANFFFFISSIGTGKSVWLNWNKLVGFNIRDSIIMTVATFLVLIYLFNIGAYIGFVFSIPQFILWGAVTLSLYQQGETLW